MTRSRLISLAGVVADDNLIVTSVTPAAGGVQSFTIAAQPPQAIIIDIDCTGNEVARTFIVSGTDRVGNAITESVTGVNGSVAQTTKQFETITGITVDDDTADAIKIGHAAVVYSGWFPMNTYGEDADATVAVKVTGTVNFDLQYTFEDLQDQRTAARTDVPYGDYEMTVDTFTDATIDGDTADVAIALSLRPTGIRFIMNSGAGSIAARVLQAYA